MIQTTIYRPTSSLQEELSRIESIKYEDLDGSIKKKINLKNYYSDISIKSVCKSIKEMISNFNSNLVNHEDGVNSFMTIEPGDVIEKNGKYYFVNSERVSQMENFE